MIKTLVSKDWVRASVCGAVCLALWMLFLLTLFWPYDVSVQVGNNAPMPVSLPHNGASGTNEVSVYRGFFQIGLLSNTEVQIVPDDGLLSLNVNGQEVDLSRIPGWKLKDWREGFSISLKSYLKPGRNSFEIAVVNESDPYGLQLWSSVNSTYYLGCLMAVGMGACAFLASLSPWLRLPRAVMWLLFGAVFLRLVYLSYTSPYERSHDVGAHLEHVNYVLDKRELPPDLACWECHQPSFYYLLAGGALLAGQKVGLGAPVETLRTMALLFDGIFLIAGACLFRLVVPRYVLPCCALLFYWPSGVIHSARVNNDVIFYAFCAVSLLLAVRWALRGRTRDMVLSSVAAALVVMSKMTGLSLLPVLFCIWLTKVWRSEGCRRGLLFRQTLLAAAIIGTGLAVLYVDKLHDRWTLPAAQRIAPVVDALPPALTVGNELRNYYLFDLRDFLEEPYTNPWDDPGGRQFFFTYFLKTSLFGEFHHSEPHSQIYLAHAIKGIFLLLLLALGIGILSFRRLEAEAAALCLGLLIFPVAGLLVFRYYVPYACNQDFRYVYPITLAAIILVAHGFACLVKSYGRGWRYLFEAVVVAWIVMVCCFFIFPRVS